MCYQVRDCQVGERDVHSSEISGAQVYIHRDQFEYWKLTQLIIDVVPGRGGMFSLDNGTGKRFLKRGRVFSGEEACAFFPV